MVRITKNWSWTAALIALTDSAHTISAAYIGAGMSIIISERQSLDNLDLLIFFVLSVVIFFMSLGVKIYESNSNEEPDLKDEKRSRAIFVGIIFIVFSSAIILYCISRN
jgi:cellobiose-specific phosphotransferase system component IIC